jgi:hypothetical protein
VLYDRVEILVEHGLQTDPVAGGAMSASQRENAKESEA